MTSYELMIKVNHHLIKGGTLSEGQIGAIVDQFMGDRSKAENDKSIHPVILCILHNVLSKYPALRQ